MPVRCEIKSETGKLLKVEEVWPKDPNEIQYVGDYFRGELVGVIGAECLMSDLGGVVYLVDDPEIIEAVSRGIDIAPFFDEATAVFQLPPETDPVVEIPFTTKNGYVGKTALGHVLPPYTATLL